MKKRIIFLILCLLTTIGNSFSQDIYDLEKKINNIIKEKELTIGVSIVGDNQKDTLSINGEQHFPLQSVFKYHIALVVLTKVDKGELFLDQNIDVKKEDLLPNLYSPLRDDYPNGGNIPLYEIIEYVVSMSDNVGCDILLRSIGGPEKFNDFFRKNDIYDIEIMFNEEIQQSKWDYQFKNWVTPKAANETLLKFYINNPEILSEKSYDFIWQVMKDTQTGKKRLRGQLPLNAIVAHKTGTSGVNKEGITAAVNDIGIVFLPNGRYFAISVFVSNSKENNETNEKVISDISKLAWDFFNLKYK